MNKKMEFSFFSRFRKKFFRTKFFFLFLGTFVENHLHSFWTVEKKCFEIFSEDLFFVFKFDWADWKIFWLKFGIWTLFFFSSSSGAIRLCFWPFPLGGERGPPRGSPPIAISTLCFTLKLWWDGMAQQEENSDRSPTDLHPPSWGGGDWNCLYTQFPHWETLGFCNRGEGCSFSSIF